MSLYNDLPGVDLTIRDGNLVLPAEPSGTQRLLIIAPTKDVGYATPTTLNRNPRRVNESEDFNKHGFGIFNATNPLARRWKQAHDAGAREIFCLPLPGLTPEERYQNLHKMYTVLEENFRVDIILVDGVKVDTEIETATIDLERSREDYASVGGTANYKAEPAIEVLEPSDASDELKTIFNVKGPYNGQLIELTIKEELEDDNILAYLTEYTKDNDSWSITLHLKDDDGEPIGLTEGQTLEMKYETYDYDFAAQLAGFCASVSKTNNQVIGVMSLEPPKSGDLGVIKDYVDGQVKHHYNQFLQIVGGPELFFSIANAPYESDFSGAYAGLISYLPSYSAPTNKVIPGAIFPSFNLSPSQIRALTSKHIVVPRMRNSKLVIADAITAAGDKSDFVRLSTVRITNDAVQLVREICEPYIGEPNTLPRRNSLETQIDTALDGMRNRGAITDYRFSVKASLADQLDGNMRIALDLVPSFETRRIFITVALKPSLD